MADDKWFMDQTPTKYYSMLIFINKVYALLRDSSKLREQGIEIYQKQITLVTSIIEKAMTDPMLMKNIRHTQTAD